MKVSVGPASVTGWLAALAGVAAAIIENDPAYAKWGAVLLALTNLGRQLQAALTNLGRQLQAALVNPIAEVPPETAVQPDGAVPAAPPGV